MIGTITLYYKQRFKKAEYYEHPFLFDPQDINIRYAYPIGEYIRINFGGEIIDVDFDKKVWEALEKRFTPNKVTPGFKPLSESKKHKRKHKPVVKF